MKTRNIVVSREFDFNRLFTAYPKAIAFFLSLEESHEVQNSVVLLAPHFLTRFDLATSGRPRVAGRQLHPEWGQPAARMFLDYRGMRFGVHLTDICPLFPCDCRWRCCFTGDIHRAIEEVEVVLDTLSVKMVVRIL